MLPTLSSLLTLSLAINFYLFFRNKKKPKQETYEVGELLSDLLAGQAMVRVERIAPADVLIRSPRT